MAEKQKKPIFKRWWFWVIVVVVIVAIASQGGEDEPKLSADQGGNEVAAGAENQTDEPDTPEFFKVGETVETSKVKATITELTKSEGSEFNTPEEGNEFVLLKMTIENISDNQELTISSILSFNAYVDDEALDESFSAILEGNKTMDGTIAPGKKLSGTLAYEVPKDWKEIEIHFEPEVWRDIKIKWKIENE